MADTVERAFELAPECTSIKELRAKLTSEGFSNVEAHVKDSLQRELKKLLRARTKE